MAGGHVPALIRAGYDATGVDPEAPEGPAYVRATFEEYRPEGPADAVVASVSLHHVDDPGVALDHVVGVMRPDGVLVRWESRHHRKPCRQDAFHVAHHAVRDQGAHFAFGHAGAKWSQCARRGRAGGRRR